MKIFITVDFIVNLYFISCPKFWTILDQGSPVCDQRKEKRPEIFSHDYYIHVMNNS